MPPWMLNAFVYISIVQLSFIKHATQRKRALNIPSFSAMYLSDKIFLTLLVPVAVTLFCSVPPLVIQELPGYVPSIKYPKNLFVLPDIRSLLKWNQYAKPLEDEIPLVFVHEKYPQSGNKKFSLHEYKYLKMAEKMAEAKTQNEDPQPSHIGYVYIYDSIKSKELPTVRI